MYFNFASRSAEDWWGRREFLHAWWRGNARDRRWIPPRYRLLNRAIVHRREPFLNTRLPVPLTVEAVVRQSQSSGYGNIGSVFAPAGMGHAIVGQALALTDTGNSPATLFLSLMAFANDAEALESLLQAGWQQGAAQGARRLVAPAELAPSFSAGLLLDNFHLPPPLHTPYNAPYLPELVEVAMEPLRLSRLWFMETTTRPPLPSPPHGLEIAPIDAMRLAGDLLPLLQTAVQGDDATASPAAAPLSAAEAEFALRMASDAPLLGRLALLDGVPVGFVLAQADVGAALRRLRGGRPLWARAALAIRPPVDAAAGRVLLGGVLPQAQGQGIARHLLDNTLRLAADTGWRVLAIGPVVEESAAAQLLAKVGATQRQRYGLFVQEK